MRMARTLDTAAAPSASPSVGPEKSGAVSMARKGTAAMSVAEMESDDCAHQADGGPWEESPDEPCSIVVHRNRRELGQLVAELAPEDICEERVLDFLRRILTQWSACEDFSRDEWDDVILDDDRSYLFLAAKLLMAGELREAVYVMLYVALRVELVFRGPKRLTEIVAADGASLRRVCSFCRTLDEVAEASSRSKVTQLLIHWCQMYESVEERADVRDLLSALEKEDGPERRDSRALHSLRGADTYLCGTIWLTVTNLDDGSASRRLYYTDATLGWLLKRSTQRLTSDRRYFRVVHNGNSLFLSSSGKKTLLALGIRDGDFVEFGGVCRPDEDSGRGSSKKAIKATPRPNKRRGNTKGPKKKASPPRPRALSDETLAARHKQKHSRSMNPVLEELSPILKKIRGRLHNLAMKKTAPKVKRPSVNATDKMRVAPLLQFVGESNGKKAGKTVYPILVGEVSNLYKTSKLPHKQFATIDLHAYTKDQALEKLEASLPLWMEAAMRRSYPWVVGVDIVCGGGSQILSEAVKGWIRDRPQVANRPKGPG